jgi:hypothetical protein
MQGLVGHPFILEWVQQQQRRASIPEIVGAWLHVWTPPRDARVPPVPWRKLAIGAAVGVLIVGAALALLVPRIQTSKAERAAENRAAAARAEAANRARITRAQRPRHGDAAALLPAAGATLTEREAAREALLDRLEADMFADARERAAKGEMRPVTGPTTCERAPGSPASGAIRVFDCFIVTTRIEATERNLPGALGYPFRAVVDYSDFSYTWCKAEQVPGEMLVLLPDKVVLLPPECRGPKA